MSKISFSLSNQNITVTVDGNVHNFSKGNTNFEPLRKALIEERYSDVPKLLCPTKTLADWLAKAGTDFSNNGGVVTYLGEALPDGMQKKVRDMVAEGKDPSILFHFWKRLQNNPSARSVEQLWTFLQQSNIPLTDEGFFLAYKKVQEDYMDFYTQKVPNTIGSVHAMPRNKISDDPNHACHFGFHVGSLRYAQHDYHSGSGRLIIVKVDPADVVSVPYDYSCQKMRVCKYEVIGHYGGALSSTTHEKEDYDLDGDLEDVELDVAVDEVVLQDEEKETTTTQKKVAIPKRFQKLHAMSYTELLEQPIAELRAYATHGLKVVGASKIPGGKVALLDKIISSR